MKLFPHLKGETDVIAEAMIELFTACQKRFTQIRACSLNPMGSWNIRGSSSHGPRAHTGRTC